jgi:hypothetical protein
MVRRRQLLTTAMFGGFVAHPGAVEEAVQSPAERQFQAFQDIVDGVKNIGRVIETAHSFTEIGEVRLRQVAFLRAEGKFPDFIDLGVDVWMGVHDWHIKHGLPMPLGRDANNRYTIMLLATTLVLRPDFVPTHIGTPYENRG